MSVAKGTKTGGRQKGSVNKSTLEIKAIARQYGPAAVKKLAEMAGLVKGKPAATSEQAQAMANRDLLDRGYGRPTQGIELAPTEGFEAMLDRIVNRSGS